jgi:hypothetical protein
MRSRFDQRDFMAGTRSERTAIKETYVALIQQPATARRNAPARTLK